MTLPRKRRAPAREARSIRGTAAGATFDDVRALARKLPGVEDSTSYGTAALKVRGKLMVRLHQDRDLGCFVLRTELLDREMLVEAAPDVFFITDHYRDHPWILVRFATVDKRALPELLERAWRLVAPATLVKKYEGERG